MAETPQKAKPAKSLEEFAEINGRGLMPGESIDGSIQPGSGADWQIGGGPRGRELTEKQEASASVGQSSMDKIEHRDALFNERQRQRNESYKQGRDASYKEFDSHSEQSEIRARGLLDESTKQSNDAKKVYSNLSTRMDSVVNDAEREQKNAMSLSQYMDPSKSAAFNNVNNMYQNQAQNEGRAGLADYGVLSSLGAQSMGQGMAGMGPLTAGQQMGMLAQSQRQAGAAYANTQNRMQQLRDQGLQTGMNFHDKAYEAGLNAKDRYGNALKDREGVTTRGIQNMGILRGERNGYGSQITGEQNARTGRGLGKNQENYGMDTAFEQDKMARGNAIDNSRVALSDKEYARYFGEMMQGQSAQAQQSAQRAQMVGTGLQVAGTVAGSVIGGPIGGMAGGAAGSMAGAAVAQPPPPQAAGFAPSQAPQVAQPMYQQQPAPQFGSAGTQGNGYGRYNLQTRMAG